LQGHRTKLKRKVSSRGQTTVILCSTITIA